MKIGEVNEGRTNVYGNIIFFSFFFVSSGIIIFGGKQRFSENYRGNNANIDISFRITLASERFCTRILLDFRNYYRGQKNKRNLVYPVFFPLNSLEFNFN